MTDFGRRVGAGDMLKSVYDANNDAVVDAVIAHLLSHQLGGSDEISVAGLSGQLAAAQPSAWAIVAGKPSTFPPTAHKSSHQSGGADAINVTGLVGTTPGAILGDGTSGRVLRSLFIIIGDGTTADTLKCRAGNIWNGHTVAETDNIAKNATTGVWTLSSGGHQLWIETAGLGVNTIFCHAHIRNNDTNTPLRICARTQASRIRLECSEEPGGDDQDMTLIVLAAELSVDVLYITDA